MDDYSDETPPAWSAYKDEIKTVEIYGNVTKIGANAFKNLSKCDEFYIEGSIQREVGDGAFSGTSIKTVQLPVHAMPIEGHILFSGSTESNESGVKAYISGDALNYAFRHLIMLSLKIIAPPMKKFLPIKQPFLIAQTAAV